VIRVFDNERVVTAGDEFDEDLIALERALVSRIEGKQGATESSTCGRNLSVPQTQI
jgi:hypothetical protein